MKVILISGLSGSGKSVALRALEDQGFFCIDNLPPDFLPDLVNRLNHQKQHEVAVAIDARMGNLLKSLPSYINTLQHLDYDVRLLFLEADNDVIVTRYSESRRKHPAQTHLGGSATIDECVQFERKALCSIAKLGDRIDTTHLQPNTLKHWINNTVSAKASQVTIVFESFGFKRRTPTDADLVFDARCLPNPYYDKELRSYTGEDEIVCDFFSKQPIVDEFISDIEIFIRKWLPKYHFEQRSYLTIAIGCTGGQHRSVYVAKQLAQRFDKQPLDNIQTTLVRHRVIHKT
jgi:RNase adapter protein RapZ